MAEMTLKKKLYTFFLLISHGITCYHYAIKQITRRFKEAAKKVFFLSGPATKMERGGKGWATKKRPFFCGFPKCTLIAPRCHLTSLCWYNMSFGPCK